MSLYADADELPARPLAPEPDASTAALLSLWRDLAAEEREVLTMIARRLLVGQQQYGELDIANDRRNFRSEAREEWADSVVYMMLDAMKRTGPGR